MSALAFLLLIALLILFWQASSKCRDIAIQVARETCHQQGLQFLDGTVSLRRLIPYFTHGNDFGLERTYIFEYSADGVNRREGCLVMHNIRIVTVLLEDG